MAGQSRFFELLDAGRRHEAEAVRQQITPILERNV
jgi:hypothetical protein